MFARNLLRHRRTGALTRLAGCLGVNFDDAWAGVGCGDNRMWLTSPVLLTCQRAVGRPPRAAGGHDLIGLEFHGS